MVDTLGHGGTIEDFPHVDVGTSPKTVKEKSPSP
jgi:hypothetical protein